MKNRFYYIFSLIACSVSFAQVGVNTNTPQQELHVAGAASNVKVEGLNTVNNVDNLGMINTTEVYVDADGDLTLGASTRNVEILFDSENYLMDVEDPTSIIVQTGWGFGYNPAGIPMDGLAATFTLTKPAIIEVNYTVSWNIYKTASASGRIADEHARVVQTGIYFRKGNYLGPTVIIDYEGNPINAGPWCIDMDSGGINCLEQAGLLGINGQFYNNSNSRRGEYKNFHNTASDYVKLPPGTYSAMFACQLSVGSTVGTGAVKLYLGPGKDDLQIIAHYYD